MANSYCCCCRKQINFMSGSEKLSEKDDMVICSSCYRKFSTDYNVFKNASKDAERLQSNYQRAVETVRNARFDKRGEEYILSYYEKLYDAISAQVEINEEKERIAQERANRLKQIEKEQAEQRAKALASYQANKKAFILTTGPTIEGKIIKTYLGIVSGSCVLGTGMFSEAEAEWSDFFGVESDLFSKKYSISRVKAEDRMKHNALLLGANAIISIDFDFQILSSNNMICCIANGTAVQVEEAE